MFKNQTMPQYVATATRRRPDWTAAAIASEALHRANRPSAPVIDLATFRHGRAIDLSSILG